VTRPGRRCASPPHRSSPELLCAPHLCSAAHLSLLGASSRELHGIQPPGAGPDAVTNQRTVRPSLPLCLSCVCTCNTAVQTNDDSTDYSSARTLYALHSLTLSRLRSAPRESPTRSLRWASQALRTRTHTHQHWHRRKGHATVQHPHGGGHVSPYSPYAIANPCWYRALPEQSSQPEPRLPSGRPGPTPVTTATHALPFRYSGRRSTPTVWTGTPSERGSASCSTAPRTPSKDGRMVPKAQEPRLAPEHVVRVASGSRAAQRSGPTLDAAGTGNGCLEVLR